MQTTTFIYALIDPITEEVRYIGKSNNPRKRYINHTTSHHFQVHKSNWIKKLQSQGMQPILLILEEVPISNWQERERYWISYYREHGCNLINRTDGGDGLTKLSPEHRAKIGLAGKGKKRSPKTKERCKTAAQNRSASPEWRAKLSESAKKRPPMSPETRAKIAATKKAQAATPEGRANIAKMQKARPSKQSPEILAKKSETMKAKYEAGWDIGEEGRTKISVAKKGVPRSPEVIAKMSAGRKGKGTGPHSPEHLAKISAARKGKPQPRQRCEKCHRFSKSPLCDKCRSL